MKRYTSINYTRKSTNLIYFLIIGGILIFFIGSCIRSENTPSRIIKQKEEAVLVKDEDSLSEKDIEFYRLLKEKLKKAQIFSYDSPEDTPYVDFTLENLDGEKVSLSDFKGQTILLNFWATWCGPCRSEMPSMESLYKELQSLGFVLLSVNLKETRSDVAEYVKKAKISFPVLLDTTGEIGGIYGAQSIPLSFLIDTKGFVVGAVLGAKDWNSTKIKDIIKFIQARG